ncbi:MAG: hypothetical protein EP346_03765 [Bacteroidetes bacterium]|uniref:Uncharacterized protein n=1 Tax=Phaeocystidibacter marisrubri TaxID=1577780 RepID=A0A6L3ZHM7_9FLAO|nr:hypothetical protein [Phaeocystidibacter marisrubri]KAB2817337.1 hypothetical protein F8C82_02795 [Phaeocystidibacter marisrubri]TNE30450.1 MAG: hypothetical protein EP346_03765 [Bacteroidota bacterium]GGH75854.1 hypothetical protein GCM10011318_23300 [Phaeocystidibacter marisrubri]
MKRTWIAAVAIMGLVACNGGESTENASEGADMQMEETMNDESTDESAPMEMDEVEMDETDDKSEMEEPANDASSATEAPAEESTAGQGGHLTQASKGGRTHETIQKEVETETEALSTEGTRQMQETETAVRK